MEAFPAENIAKQCLQYSEDNIQIKLNWFSCQKEVANEHSIISTLSTKQIIIQTSLTLFYMYNYIKANSCLAQMQQNTQLSFYLKSVFNEAGIRKYLKPSSFCHYDVKQF